MKAAPRPLRLPPHGAGQVIGLYGGSFDPPHAGHRHVALLALRRLGLDRVWWLVTPGNPLKTRRPGQDQAARLAAARALARHPRMEVAAIESGERAYTVNTIRAIRRRCPEARFVWIMGADSLSGFQEWRDWLAIAAMVPIAVVDRPGWTLRATRSRAALALAPWRLPEREARRLGRLAPPAWCFLHGPRSGLSSTALRKTADVPPSPPPRLITPAACAGPP